MKCGKPEDLSCGDLLEFKATEIWDAQWLAQAAKRKLCYKSAKPDPCYTTPSCYSYCRVYIRMMQYIDRLTSLNKLQTSSDLTIFLWVLHSRKALHPINNLACSIVSTNFWSTQQQYSMLLSLFNCEIVQVQRKRNIYDRCHGDMVFRTRYILSIPTIYGIPNSNPTPNPTPLLYIAGTKSPK